MGIKILITDPLSKTGVDILKDIPDAIVDERPKIAPEELKKIIKDYDVLLVRSGTKVTSDIIEGADKLKFIGRAGVGLDNVDVDAATRKGIIVMNTPGGNTVSTAEHAFSLLVAMARNIPQAYLSLKEKKWDRKKYMGVELHGKVLGIIGLGRIGREVAKRAQAFEMSIIGYDPFLPIEKFREMGISPAEIDEICEKADFITIHTPLTEDTRYLINEERLKKMKPTARLVNCARGGIVDEKALAKALDEGWIAGAALDVYENEPLADWEWELFDRPNLIGTPHLGASTKEAQEKVAVQIAQQIYNAVTGKGIFNAANYPSLAPGMYEVLYPYVNLAERLGMFLSQIVEGRISSVYITYRGEPLVSNDTNALRKAIIKGILSHIVQDAINYVNAELIADERGLEVKEGKTTNLEDYANLIEISVKTDKRMYYIAGSIFKKDEPRIVRIDDFDLEAIPAGTMLLSSNDDKPGVIGSLGTVLGKNNVNIASMTFGRKQPEGIAMMLFNLDSDIDNSILKEFLSVKDVHWGKIIRLPGL